MGTRVRISGDDRKLSETDPRGNATYSSYDDAGT